MNAWPEDLLEAVGEGYHAASADGGNEVARLADTTSGYLGIGGDPPSGTVVLPDLICHLGRT